jgi:hypothetical protein
MFLFDMRGNVLLCSDGDRAKVAEADTADREARLMSDERYSP